MISKLGKILLLFILAWEALPIIAFGYQGGVTKAHNHTSAAGDGGLLTGLTLGGTTYHLQGIQVGTTTAPSYMNDTLGDVRALSVGSAKVRGSISNQISSDQASAHFSGAKAEGTPLNPLIVQPLDYITVLSANPYDGVKYLLPGFCGFQVTPGTTTATDRVPTDFVVTTGTGTPADGTERFRIDYAGHVGINKGGVTDTNAALSVSAIPGVSAGRFLTTDNTFASVTAQNLGNGAALALSGASVEINVAGAGAPPNSFALCFLGGNLGHCTSVVGAGGGCTCSQP